MNATSKTGAANTMAVIVSVAILAVALLALCLSVSEALLWLAAALGGAT